MPQVGYNIYVIPDDVLTIVLTFGVLDAAGARKKRAQLKTKSGKEQMQKAGYFARRVTGIAIARSCRSRLKPLTACSNGALEHMGAVLGLLVFLTLANGDCSICWQRTSTFPAFTLRRSVTLSSSGSDLKMRSSALRLATRSRTSNLRRP